jgi:hypothetical protein
VGKNPRQNEIELVLDGSLAISRTEELKGQLSTALDTANCVKIGFGTIDEVDLSFLQLLCSASILAAGRKQQLVCTAEKPALLQRAIESAGFVRHTGCRHACADNCLWKTL